MLRAACGSLWIVPVVVATLGTSLTRAQTARPAPVRLGIDVLIADGFKPLVGKRVGLITNPTGVTGDLRSTIDVLHAAPGVQLVTLFGPEHGMRGETPAGDDVADDRDAATGLPVHSLYGKYRKPAPEMLAGLDVLVYDIQDIGARSYTYISTLALAMEAAAEQKVAFVVLDRPNPLGGIRMEGRPLDLQFQSFIGQIPVPYLHGMTVGELAQMINGEGWTKDGVKCDLQVHPHDRLEAQHVLRANRPGLDPDVAARAAGGFDVVLRGPRGSWASCRC